MGKSSLAWRKSTYSGATSGNCVEVGHARDRVLIRDTKSRDSFTLNVPPLAWQVFAQTLKK